MLVVNGDKNKCKIWSTSDIRWVFTIHEDIVPTTNHLRNTANVCSSDK